MEEGSGVKHDAEKIRTDLYSTVALEELAKVLTFGARKYGAQNWRRGMAWSRLLGAAIRHIFAFMRGENLDHETGLPHLAHAMCCLMFLLEYYITGNGSDDRWNEICRMPNNEVTDEHDFGRKLEKKG